MSKNTRWPIEAFQKKGLVQDGSGNFVPVKSLVAKGKIEKIEPKVPKFNRRVKNTEKIKQGNIVFDSRLELFLYNLLKAAGISFEFQRKIMIQDGFTFGTEKIRAIHIIIDFWLPKRALFIDSKGFQLADGKLKYKLFKKYLVDKYPNRNIKIEMPKNQTECRELVNRLLYDPL